MKDTFWIAVDTETSGINTPIYAVEIAAQKMRGWEPDGESFRVLLNHDVPIESTAEALHGYSRSYLRKHGVDPVLAHEAFAAYAGDCPIVAYNLGFDWKRVLVPEYERLGIKGAGREGFCALTLARRVIHDTENYRLETLKHHFQLSSERSHKAKTDVDIMVRLMSQIMAPRLERAGLTKWEDVARFSRKGPIRLCREMIMGRDMVKIPSSKFQLPRRRNVSHNDATGATKERSEEISETKAFYVRHYDAWIEELFGICRGILANKGVDDAGIHQLAEWLENCPCTHLYPVKAVVGLMENIIPDGKISNEEMVLLRKGLEEILPVGA